MTKPKVVCLCGSTRFKDDFLEWNKNLTLAGYIVLIPGVFGHADNIEWTDDIKKLLDILHKQKILMSDEIFVIDRDGYIGESTKSEIKFAEDFGIPITYMTDMME